MACTLHPFTPRDRAAAIALWRNPGLSFVARADGVLVGAVLCGHDGRRGYLHHLAVAPAHRRLGIGRRLVARCLSALARQDIPKCNIFVYGHNACGRAFWRRAGWKPRPDLELLQRFTPASPEFRPRKG